jgi:hypothetical protein
MGIDNPVDVLLCLFIASVALVDAPRPNRDVGDRRVGYMPVVVEERGRVEDEASLGNADAALRAVLLGAPEARFLAPQMGIKFTRSVRQKALHIPLLNHVCLQRQGADHAVKFLEGLMRSGANTEGNGKLT